METVEILYINVAFSLLEKPMNNLSLIFGSFLVATSLFAQTAGTKWVKGHFYLEGKKARI